MPRGGGEEYETRLAFYGDDVVCFLVTGYFLLLLYSDNIYPKKNLKIKSRTFLLIELASKRDLIEPLLREQRAFYVGTYMYLYKLPRSYVQYLYIRITDSYVCMYNIRGVASCKNMSLAVRPEKL